MSATKINLTIEKGATYYKSFIWRDKTKVPISISGLSARMQIRASLNSTSFEVELTTATGEIVLEAGSETGRVDITIGATVTDALTIDIGVYDLELYDPADPDNVTRLVEGIVSVVEGVTR
jgi:hypothetical protein